MNQKENYIPLQAQEIDLAEEELYETTSTYTARKHASRRRLIVLTFYLCVALLVGLIVGALSRSRELIKSYMATTDPKVDVVLPLNSSFHVVGNATNSLRGKFDSLNSITHANIFLLSDNLLPDRKYLTTWNSAGMSESNSGSFLSTG